ncbi:hypothetical protein SNL152K_6630 [Streptomyces sp. NL15-2K]|nr:hypothetical protein SNL152K_6630 [Streptomyces sp. NL15-2K]
MFGIGERTTNKRTPNNREREIEGAPSRSEPWCPSDKS